MKVHRTVIPGVKGQRCFKLSTSWIGYTGDEGKPTALAISHSYTSAMSEKGAEFPGAGGLLGHKQQLNNSLPLWLPTANLRERLG